MVSGKSGIPEAALREDLKKIKEEVVSKETESVNLKNKEEKVSRKERIKRKLLGIVLWQKTLPNPNLQPGKIIEGLLKIYPGRDNLFPEEEKTKEDLIFEAEIFYQGEADLDKDVAELLKNLQEEHWREELESKMAELRKAEAAGDREKSTRILKECQELGDKIQSIKK